MRFLVLALMIALLPLRGWVGEVMATEMAFEVPKALLEAKNTKTAAMHDCEGHAKADEATQTDSHCDVCPACQACHTVALSHLETHAASLAPPAALPHSPAAQFASAVAALGQKPPIS